MPKSSSSSSGDESSIEREAKKIESLIFDNFSDVSESEFPALPRDTNTNRKTEKRTIQNEEKKSFASAAGGGTRQLSTDIKELLNYKDMITEQDGIVKVEIPEEELTEEKKKIIIFKTFCLKALNIDKICDQKIEKCLKPIWQDITYLARGKKFGTIVVSFKNAETAQKHAIKSLESEDTMLIPIYIGMRTSKERIPRIPPGVNPMCLMAAVLVNREDNINLLPATVTENTYWTGQTLNLTLQADLKILERLPEIVEVGEEVLNILVEGRKPRCFQCGHLSHIKKYCKEGVEESDGEEEERERETEEKSKQQKVNGRLEPAKAEQAETKKKKKNGQERQTEESGGGDEQRNSCTIQQKRRFNAGNKNQKISN
ncbi:EPM2A-interacting 1-like [Octopus vulgaris]|uniref:EPM2A-interacting 1-like n=1 Tax=Octopus vulgaris TaxID=6645 RepID=A0AA36B3I0_OCTVU|nr:EPM2A-interacting 1-like [Octopus vulgaris]